MSDEESPPEEQEDEEARPPGDVRRYLPFIGLLVAVWATLPKYSGPALHVKGGAATEFVDHIVPGIVIAVASLVCIAFWQRAKGPGLVPFSCGALALLCGLWMVATHWQLILQATRNQAPWAGAIYHTTAAVAVFGFGLLWTMSHWPDFAAAIAEDDRKRAAAAS